MTRDKDLDSAIADEILKYSESDNSYGSGELLDIFGGPATIDVGSPARPILIDSHREALAKQIADRLISLGFTRAGGGVSSDWDTVFNILLHTLNMPDAGTKWAQTATNRIFAVKAVATPQPIALEGVTRYICTPNGMERDDGLGGMLACWINVGDLVPASVKKEGDHE